MTPSIREVKPYTPKELSEYYGVSDKTFKKWLSPFAIQIGQKNGRYYTVAQVIIIFDVIGVPGVFDDQYLRLILEEQKSIFFEASKGGNEIK